MLFHLLAWLGVRFPNYQEKGVRDHNHPWRSTQNWYPLVIQCLVDLPIKIVLLKTALCLSTDKTKIHLLFLKLQVIAVLLSLKASDQHNFQMKLETSSSIYGEIARKADMKGVFQMRKFFLSRTKRRSYCYWYDYCTIIFAWRAWKRMFVHQHLCSVEWSF